ncbi:hypothetical protein N7481_001617 [Penicillium waksmanii]|uniref:uncharacterized protein n=1 Tax=Penicillium waksmanii TaxID=69791 RepID=UPI0025498386|nr:uncharacterized protein N7481_001617 [Penicillium waksmanii]KAJ6001208.1 hypothetical protein N7481_001617 [Penicillium waksmanii]
MNPSEDAELFNDSNLLGQSLNLLPGEHDPFNLDIIEGEKSTVVKPTEETRKATFADGKAYLLPKNVRANIGNRKTTVKSLIVEAGDKLAQTLDASASLSGSYAGFSASASAQYSYASSLSNTNYYALLSVDHTSFTLALEGHDETDENINPSFVKAVERLPDWDSTDKVHDQYMRFFHSWGTHYIKSCTFGARYQLKIENHASKSESKEEFEANVSAEYSGVANVKGEASLKTSNEYKSYLKTRQFQTKVFGGSSSSNIILGNAPDDPEKYQEAFKGWADSLNDAVASNLVSVKVDSIGNLLENSSFPEHNDLSEKLTKALDFMASKRLAEGFLKFSLPTESAPLNYARGLSIQGAPGIIIRQSSQGFSRFEIDCVVRLSPQTTVTGISWSPVDASLQPPSKSKTEIGVFYSGVENTERMKNIRSKGHTVEGDVTIDAVIPLSIFAPPGALTVELSNPTQRLSSTDLDLSPRGPRLNLAGGKSEQKYEIRSLFLPGSGNSGVHIGACFAEN